MATSSKEQAPPVSETDEEPKVSASERKTLASHVAAAYKRFVSSDKAYKLAQVTFLRDEVVLGRAIASAQEKIGEKRIIAFCRDDAGIPESVSDQTLYRWRGAGLASLRLDEGGFEHPGMASTALARIARFSDDPKTLAKVWRASVKAQKTRDAAASPEYASVGDGISAVFPEGAKQGGGSVAGSGTARNGSTGTADKPKTPKSASAPKREQVPAADIDAAVSNIGRILNATVKDGPEGVYPVAKRLVGLTVEICQTYGPTAVRMALDKIDAAEAAVLAAEAAEAK